MTVITIIFIIFAKTIINVVLGNEWVADAWMFQILSLVILPFGIQILSRNILKAGGDTRLIFKIETFKSIVVLGILLPSILGGIKVIVWSVALGQTFATFYCIHKTLGFFNKRSIGDFAGYGILTLILYGIVAVLIKGL